MDLAFRARRVLTPQGELPRTIGITDGRIVAIEPFEYQPKAAEVITLDPELVLLPGLVDTHVHVNDPGRSEWEGFASATKAAAAGGITTIVDMPLNCLPPTVDPTALTIKRNAARDRVYIDVGFWGGAIPGNDEQLPGLHEAGVFGFKCFLLHSGVEEFPALDARGLAGAMDRVAALGTSLIVHAEDARTVETAPAAHGRRYADFLASRPRSAESAAVAQVIRAARSSGARAHILHLSSAEAIEMIAQARRDGVAITAETCPHYLSFCAEEITDGATEFKCCPPIRDARNRELLWRGLQRGVIDTVVSDHSPCTVDLKCLESGDFGLAWGGVSSLQLGLPAVWTQARQRGYRLADVVRWMAESPARLVGLHRKGRIALGCDADLCVFAPDDAFVVDRDSLAHRNPLTAYHGRPLAGVVRSTWLRGREITGDLPRGRLLSRGER
ncbi:MAG: allantoinase AllB [Sciscionella sp.]